MKIFKPKKEAQNRKKTKLIRLLPKIEKKMTKRGKENKVTIKT